MDSVNEQPVSVAAASTAMDMDPEAYLNSRHDWLAAQQQEQKQATVLAQTSVALPVEAPAEFGANSSAPSPATHGADTTYYASSEPRFYALDLEQMEHALTLHETTLELSIPYEEVDKCIDVVHNVMQSMNWRVAFDELTKLCFTSMIIAFIMARRAYPEFPSLADWGVIARMRAPFLRDECLFENPRRADSEPRWAAKCFPDGQLMLGTGADHRTLYIKNSNDTWTRLKMMIVSADINKWINAQLERERDTDANAVKYNTKIWEGLGEIVSSE